MYVQRLKLKVPYRFYFFYHTYPSCMSFYIINNFRSYNTFSTLSRVYFLLQGVEHLMAILSLVLETDDRKLLVICILCVHITKFIIYCVYFQNSVYTHTYITVLNFEYLPNVQGLRSQLFSTAHISVKESSPAMHHYFPDAISELLATCYFLDEYICAVTKFGQNLVSLLSRQIQTSSKSPHFLFLTWLSIIRNREFRLYI